jgi:hypothetical protein
VTVRRHREAAWCLTRYRFWNTQDAAAAAASIGSQLRTIFEESGIVLDGPPQTVIAEVFETES